MSENQMTLEEAAVLLADCYRYQHGSGRNCEVDWYERERVDGDNQKPFANGEFWANEEYEAGVDIFLPSGRVEFTRDEAWALFGVGKRRGSVGEK